MAINVSGSFVIGFFLALISEHFIVHPKQKNFRTRSCQVLPSLPHGRSATVRVSCRWTYRAGVLPPGHRATVWLEESRRVTWARAASIAQVSRRRGVVLGNNGTSVSPSSEEAKESMLPNNPPFIDRGWHEDRPHQNGTRTMMCPNPYRRFADTPLR
jgi:hypothetical protein